MTRKRITQEGDTPLNTGLPHSFEHGHPDHLHNTLAAMTKSDVEKSVAFEKEAASQARIVVLEKERNALDAGEPLVDLCHWGTCQSPRLGDGRLCEPHQRMQNKISYAHKVERAMAQIYAGRALWLCKSCRHTQKQAAPCINCKAGELMLIELSQRTPVRNADGRVVDCCEMTV